MKRYVSDALLRDVVYVDVAFLLRVVLCILGMTGVHCLHCSICNDGSVCIYILYNESTIGEPVKIIFSGLSDCLPDSAEHLGSYLAGWGDWQSGSFFSQH